MTRPVLERVGHLLALSSSPNENEARNAAVLAVRLIREHRLVVSMPRATPTPGKKKTPGSKRGVRKVADPPERITSPLGGECIACGTHYRAGQHVFWFASGGGMHIRCFDEWLKKQSR